MSWKRSRKANILLHYPSFFSDLLQAEEAVGGCSSVKEFHLQMMCKSEEKVGQFSLNELKVPCKNSGSLELKNKNGPKIRQKNIMLFALQL